MSFPALYQEIVYCHILYGVVEPSFALEILAFWNKYLGVFFLFVLWRGGRKRWVFSSASRYSKYLFNFSPNLIKWALLLFTFHKYGNRGREGFCNFPQLKQPIRSTLDYETRWLASKPARQALRCGRPQFCPLWALVPGVELIASSAPSSRSLLPAVASNLG